MMFLATFAIEIGLTVMDHVPAAEAFVAHIALHYQGSAFFDWHCFKPTAVLETVASIPDHAALCLLG